MSQQQWEQDHAKLGIAAKLKGAMITVRCTGKTNNYRVKLKSVRAEGAKRVGQCDLALQTNRQTDLRLVPGTFEYDGMNGNLDVDVNGPGFKTKLLLGNFDLFSKSGNGLWSDEFDAFEKKLDGTGNLFWLLHHWGKEHADDGVCNSITPIF